jgi:hypothetical protein
MPFMRHHLICTSNICKSAHRNEVYEEAGVKEYWIVSQDRFYNG